MHKKSETMHILYIPKVFSRVFIYNFWFYFWSTLFHYAGYNVVPWQTIPFDIVSSIIFSGNITFDILSYVCHI